MNNQTIINIVNVFGAGLIKSYKEGTILESATLIIDEIEVKEKEKNDSLTEEEIVSIIKKYTVESLEYFNKVINRLIEADKNLLNEILKSQQESEIEESVDEEEGSQGREGEENQTIEPLSSNKLREDITPETPKKMKVVKMR